MDNWSASKHKKHKTRVFDYKIVSDLDKIYFVFGKHSTNRIVIYHPPNNYPSLFLKGRPDQIKIFLIFASSGFHTFNTLSLRGTLKYREFLYWWIWFELGLLRMVDCCMTELAIQWGSGKNYTVLVRQINMHFKSNIY